MRTRIKERKSQLAVLLVVCSMGLVMFSSLMHAPPNGYRYEGPGNIRLTATTLLQPGRWLSIRVSSLLMGRKLQIVGAALTQSHSTKQMPVTIWHGTVLHIRPLMQGRWFLLLYRGGVGKIVIPLRLAAPTSLSWKLYLMALLGGLSFIVVHAWYHQAAPQDAGCESHQFRSEIDT